MVLGGPPRDLKQLNLRYHKIGREEITRTRNRLRKKERGTINLDAADLRAPKTRSKKTGIPYQRLDNALLFTSVSQQKLIQSCLARLEQELRKIKRHIAA